MTVDHTGTASAPVAHGPRVLIFPDGTAVARALARRIAAAAEVNPTIVLGLPTGRTPLALYRELGALHAAGADFSQVTTFNLDEFLGVAPVAPRKLPQLHGDAPVPAREYPGGAASISSTAPLPIRTPSARRYEQAIAAAGGIDLQILGIGTNGHIGFNEPARELQARTHRVTLKPATRRSNAALFGGDPAQVPAEALSMGMATILRARAVVLLATGDVEGRVCRAGGAMDR